LPCAHSDGLDTKLPITHVEQVLEVGPEKINHEDIVKSFLAEMVNLGYTGCNKWTYFSDLGHQSGARGDVRVPFSVL